MANTAVKTFASPNRLSYILTGDGTVAGPTLANAALLADMVDGPLKDAWNSTYANQAAMRLALLGGKIDNGGAPAGVDLGGGCYAIIQLLVSPVDTTAQVNQCQVDVDVDAVTATKAEINISMSDTTGQIAMLHIMREHSSVR